MYFRSSAPAPMLGMTLTPYNHAGIPAAHNPGRRNWPYNRAAEIFAILQRCCHECTRAHQSQQLHVQARGSAAPSLTPPSTARVDRLLLRHRIRLQDRPGTSSPPTTTPLPAFHGALQKALGRRAPPQRGARDRPESLQPFSRLFYWSLYSNSNI